MRDWIKAVRLDADGNYLSMEDFMPNGGFSSPMDMEFGTDSALYVLEYGKGWYSDNADSKLVEIWYVSGNQPPVANAAASVTTWQQIKIKFKKTLGKQDVYLVFPNDQKPKTELNLDWINFNTSKKVSAIGSKAIKPEGQ